MAEELKVVMVSQVTVPDRESLQGFRLLNSETQGLPAFVLHPDTNDGEYDQILRVSNVIPHLAEDSDVLFIVKRQLPNSQSRRLPLTDLVHLLSLLQLKQTDGVRPKLDRLECPEVVQDVPEDLRFVGLDVVKGYLQVMATKHTNKTGRVRSYYSYRTASTYILSAISMYCVA